MGSITMRGKGVIYRPTRQFALAATLLLGFAMAGCVRTRDIAPPAAGHPAAADSTSVAFTQPANPFASPIEPLLQGTSDMPETHSMNGMDHSTPGGAGLAVYTCPMHADVRSDRPGACPKCGMVLVPTQPAGDHQHGGKP